MTTLLAFSEFYGELWPHMYISESLFDMVFLAECITC